MTESTDCGSPMAKPKSSNSYSIPTHFAAWLKHRITTRRHNELEQYRQFLLEERRKIQDLDSSVSPTKNGLLDQSDMKFPGYVAKGNDSNPFCETKNSKLPFYIDPTCSGRSKEIAKSKIQEAVKNGKLSKFRGQVRKLQSRKSVKYSAVDFVLGSSTGSSRTMPEKCSPVKRSKRLGEDQNSRKPKRTEADHFVAIVINESGSDSCLSDSEKTTNCEGTKRLRPHGVIESEVSPRKKFPQTTCVDSANRERCDRVVKEVIPKGNQRRIECTCLSNADSSCGNSHQFNSTPCAKCKTSASAKKRLKLSDGSEKNEVSVDCTEDTDGLDCSEKGQMLSSLRVELEDTYASSDSEGVLVIDI